MNGTALNFMKIYWFQIAMSFLMLLILLVALLTMAISIKQHNQSLYYTDLFVEQYDELPLSFFALNRRGGVIWSSVAHNAFETWLDTMDVDGILDIGLIDSRARLEFNFGLLYQILL